MKRVKPTNQPDRRRTFSKDLWPADTEFTDAFFHLQFGWNNPAWGGVGSRYEKQCWKNLMQVTRRIPLRERSE